MKVLNSSPKKYGNKGHQLIELKKSLVKGMPFSIPPFTCVSVPDVNYCAKYSYLPHTIKKFITAAKRGNIAVRSSGELSMPGAMETVLNVPPNVDEIIKHVTTVHNSFNSPQCQSYRINNQLDIKGTAVVLMQMVPDPDWSGVCFVDESSVEIEGVKGLGDKLVLGKAAPETIPNFLTKRLKEVANAIFTRFGPSDIEWVYKKGRKIQVVQRRDLKKSFNSGELRVVLPEDMLLAKGSSIGALTIKAAKPLVLTSEQFTPENYAAILAADIIITNDAGSMSHPALVAKTATGAVVINMDPDAWVALYNTVDIVLADGNTGCVYKYDSTEAAKCTATGYKKVNRDPQEQVIFPEFLKTIFSKNEEYDYSVRSVINAIIHEKDEEKLRAIEAACSSYVLCACLREFRHVYSRSYPEDRQVLMLDEHVGNLLKFERDTPLFFTSMEAITTREKAKVVAERLAHHFNTFNVGSSYAGPAWATAASTLASCLLCSLPYTIVLDRLLNLAHNNGLLWGKCNSFSRIGSGLLDKKRKEANFTVPKLDIKFLTMEELKNEKCKL